MSIEERFDVKTLVVILKNFDNDGIEEYNEKVCALIDIGLYSYASKKLDLDLDSRPTIPAKSSIEEPPVLELKEFPRYLRCVFLVEKTLCS